MYDDHIVFIAMISGSFPFIFQCRQGVNESYLVSLCRNYSLKVLFSVPNACALVSEAQKNVNMHSISV